ncbi:uncharacterized protein G2W53_003842 [Senna tora]|uniref:Uncharacterized protein n=1 Tax=Senna tora TaxID=362788 RepID=A0A835CGS0_9FABA|nr:uncharacterized protein G2W53_003842 [Senna tora]
MARRPKSKVTAHRLVYYASVYYASKNKTLSFFTMAKMTKNGTSTNQLQDISINWEWYHTDNPIM